MKIKLGIALLLTVLIACKKEVVKTAPKQDNHSQFQKYYFDAERAELANSFQDAITAYEAALRYENNAAVHYRLSKLYTRTQGDPKAIIQQLKEAIKLEPNNSWYLHDYAMLYYRLGDLKESLKYFHLAVDNNPKSIALLEDVMTLYIDPSPTDALQFYNQLVALTGETEELVWKKHTIYKNMGDIKAAGKVLEDYEAANIVSSSFYFFVLDFYNRNEMTADAKRYLNHLIQKFPTDGRVLLEQSNMLTAEGKDAEAFEYMKAAVKTGDLSSQTVIQIFEEYEAKLESDPNFLRPFNELIALAEVSYANNPEVLSRMALVFMNLDDYPKAKSLWNQSLKIKRSFDTQNNLSDSLKASKEYQELSVVAADMIEEFPTSAKAYYHLGWAYLKMKNYTEALHNLITARELVIEDPLLTSEIESALGSVYYKTNNWSEAQKSFETALIQDPNNASALNNYSYYSALRGVQLDKALAMVSHALELQPQNPNYMDTYGYIFFKKGNYASAIQAFSNALKLAPNEEEIIEHYGDALALAGKTAEAVEQWKKVLALNPSHPKIKEKIEKQKYIE